jgi:predicted HicB family RNase H-like nuclease
MEHKRRGPKPKDNPKIMMVGVRVTPDEHRDLAQRASAAGLTLAQLVRRSLAQAG